MGKIIKASGLQMQDETQAVIFKKTLARNKMFNDKSVDRFKEKMEKRKNEQKFEDSVK